MNITRRPRPSRSRHLRSAFTLLEVIVVVTIIALLATMVMPLLGWVGKSRQRIALTEAATIAKEVNLWMLENGMSTLPNDFDLQMLTEGDDSTLEPKDLFDPWERPYILQNPGLHNPREFDIISYGANGEPGGEGEDADIHNE